MKYSPTTLIQSENGSICVFLCLVVSVCLKQRNALKTQNKGITEHLEKLVGMG